jgi:hypothetical protein
MSQPRTPAMPSDDAALDQRGRPPRLLGAIAAGLGALFAAALFLGLFDRGLPPRPARAAVAAAAVSAPFSPRLCFQGPGGELLGFGPAEQRCP